MKHSKLVPISFLKGEKLSIIEISRSVIGFYKKMSLIDDCYSTVSIISEHPSLYDTIDVNGFDSEIFLANEILHQNLTDIRKIDKVLDPDINFSRDTSIMFSLSVDLERNTLVTLFFSFSTISSSIARIVVNEECLNTLDKSRQFMTTIVDSFKVEYGAIKISDRVLNREVRKYVAPLGVITYFSNDYGVSIPEDLEGVKYDYVDGGMFLFLENYFLQGNDFDNQKHELLTIMQEIERRVPEYLK